MKIDLKRFDMRTLKAAVSEGMLGGVTIVISMNVKDLEAFNANAGIRPPLTASEVEKRESRCKCAECIADGDFGQHWVHGTYYWTEYDLMQQMNRGKYSREDAVKAKVRECIITTLTHEVDECLYIDGVQFTDPHPEITEQKRRDAELRRQMSEAVQRLRDTQGKGDESWFLDPETKQRPAGQTPTQPQATTPDMMTATK